MKRKYQQLSFEQRITLQALVSQMKRPSGKPNISQIAQQLKVSRQTIYNELKRNGSPIYGKYTAIQAQKRRDERRKNSNKQAIIESNPLLRAYIEQRLKEDGWSVEGIVKRTKEIDKEKEEEIGRMVCVETIYRYIYRQVKGGGEDWRIYLRFGHKRRQKRCQEKRRRGIIKGRKMIDEREKVVEMRSRIGDWEIDTMEMKGHKGYILTMIERVSRYTQARILPCKDADVCAEHIIDMLYPFMVVGWLKSITVDNGKEFAYHQKLTAALGVCVYFCHPYSSWEKGSIESIHSQYRRFIPKKVGIDELSQEYLDSVVEYLNNRPRKSLGWKSSNEILSLHLEARLKEMNDIFQNQKLSNFQVESAFLYICKTERK